MKISIIPFHLCLSKSSSGQEVLVMTLADLRAKSSANLIGLLHCFQSGELLRWLMSIGQNDAVRMIEQLDSKQRVRTILFALKKYLQLPVSDEVIDLTCRKQEAPLTLIGWRSLSKLSDIKSRGDLGVLYECWKSGDLARKLADIGRNDLSAEISKMPPATNIRKVLFKLREIFGLTIKTPQIDAFCGAMVPPLNIAWNSPGKEKLVWTIAELRKKMSCDDLRGLYECWESGELARWLADIGQDQILNQLFKANKLLKGKKLPWGRAVVHCLKNALRLSFSESDIDNLFQRTGESVASKQSVDENKRPNNSCQSTINNGSPLSQPATYGCYTTSPSCADIWAERARQEQSECLSFQQQVQREQKEWIRQRLVMQSEFLTRIEQERERQEVMRHEQEKQNEVGFGRGKMQIYPGGGQPTIGGLIVAGLLLAL